MDSIDIGSVNISDPNNYLPLEEIYCGAKVHFLNDNEVIASEIKNFRIRVLDFYIEWCVQIKKRFKFENDVLLFTSKFSPEVVISGKHNSISEVQKFFPYLNINLEELDFEYRLLSEMSQIKDYVISDGNNDFVHFWLSVNNLKNGLGKPMFSNVIKVATLIMSLPHSSAAAERAFSQMSLIKTKLRNRLLINTFNSIMHTKDLLHARGENCFSWKPSQKMLRYNKTIVSEIEICDDDVFGNEQ